MKMDKKRQWKINVHKLKCFVKFIGVLAMLVEIVTSKENHNVGCVIGSAISGKIIGVTK